MLKIRSPASRRRCVSAWLNIAANRINKDGVLILEASQFRTQEQNRQEAINRLVELIRRAAHKPKARKKTRPTAASIERRLQRKHHRSQTKRLRRSDSLPQE